MTTTSRFGVGRREGHDASAFYARFRAPIVSVDDRVNRLPQGSVEGAIVHGDARGMRLEPSSVALVVTSPPYFAGKAYEEALGCGGIPGSYLEYLQLLTDVFARCTEALEPGGRMAVNVANLGRKPYRSLASDVIRILQDDLGLLLRGEVVWVKAEGASGSCAWGSFRSPSNPVLRDISERVVIASKGRFDRARTAAQRRAEGLPWRTRITSDEFMDATLDVWRIPPESASRVGHPAPFPVELPMRLIDLYTYEDDLVLDPFVGSGSTAVAASRRGRRFVGYDTDEGYVRAARARVACEAGPQEDDDAEAALAAPALAERLVTEAGFTNVRRGRRLASQGLTVDLVAEDGHGDPWCFEVSGAYTVARGGLARSELLWAALGRASAIARQGDVGPVVLLTSRLPARRSAGDRALRAAGPDVVFDAMEMHDADGRRRLLAYAEGGWHKRPLPGFWSEG